MHASRAAGVYSIACTAGRAANLLLSKWDSKTLVSVGNLTDLDLTARYPNEPLPSGECMVLRHRP